ncbi:uncharacterized protein UDID_17377 [Ustilago sp. UG-2017a]|nr:uncharacterized protein UDID_17377 [Ustilago sp. UG-2017a]
MPPSTRAGQTGREEKDDDQAAATMGNGREEGWLTQVVRILQLANPVLTAEEAIIRAMGLVSISNQAPRGEAEKIPKDVSSAIAHIKKLSDNNWHTWEPPLLTCWSLNWSRQIVQQLSSCATAIEVCDDSSVALRWLSTISIDTKFMMTPRSGVSVDDNEVDGVGDKGGGVGDNSVASTRVSSVLTNACGDPRTAVDYCLWFYLSGPLTCYGSPSDIR